MATATVTLTRNKNIEPDTLGRHCVYFGTVAITANPDTYATGGLTMSFAGVSGIPHNEPPVTVYVWSESAADGFLFQYLTGTTNANGKLQILAASGGTAGTGAVVTEMTNLTAIPAAISGDTKLRFEARWIHGR